MEPAVRSEGVAVSAGYQSLQVGVEPPQQQLQPVGDDVDLLLGLHAVVSGDVQQQLGGDLLQRAHLLPPPLQLLLQLLPPGGDTGSAPKASRSYQPG